MGSDEQDTTISLRGLRIRGFHGVFNFEREQGQDFIVDLDVHIDMPLRDAIDQTVDYSQLAKTVVGIVGGPPVNLIETLAARIADEVLEDPRIRKVRVCVHKPQAPLDESFDDVGVAIVRSKHV